MLESKITSKKSSNIIKPLFISLALSLLSVLIASFMDSGNSKFSESQQELEVAMQKIYSDEELVGIATEAERLINENIEALKLERQNKALPSFIRFGPVWVLWIPWLMAPFSLRDLKPKSLLALGVFPVFFTLVGALVVVELLTIFSAICASYFLRRNLKKTS